MVSDDRMTCTPSMYQDNARAVISFMKDSRSLRQLHARGLEVGGEGGGLLLPVGQLHADDSHLIALLTRWRKENGFAFPTRFPVSIESTAKWLRERLLDVPDRLLFLLVSRHGRPIGHLGIANALDASGRLEIDNVVRGERGPEPGIMAAGCATMLGWIEEHLAPSEIHLRVLASNKHALRFYERLHFEQTGEIPLSLVVDGPTESLVAVTGDEPVHDTFAVMTYRPPTAFDGETLVLTAGPSIGAREVVYGLDAIERGWNSNWSYYLRSFEESFAGYVQTTRALATSSCTGALHLALAALGIGPGDEVIVPELTWIATANAVRYVGARPVFADVDPVTWCMDPASAATLIGERTRAILPVHLYGYPADMSGITSIAASHDLRVVEDAAPAIGAEWQGKRLGSFGDAAGFSFQGAKLLVTGEGGMLVTSDDDLFKRAASIADQGRDPDRTFWISTEGLKYKMSNVQAAIGLAQLERVEHLIAAKRRVHEWYREELDDLAGINFQEEPGQGRSIHWMTSIQLSEDLPLSRDDVIVGLRTLNVDTRPVFPAISQYPIWGRTVPPQPIAAAIGAQAINLPSGVRLNRDIVRYVCRCLRDVLRH